MLLSALMQQTSLRMSSGVSLQQADAQTAVNEAESKSQTLNTIIFIKSSETNQSFQCWCRTLSRLRSLILKWADNE